MFLKVLTYIFSAPFNPKKFYPDFSMEMEHKKLAFHAWAMYLALVVIGDYIFLSLGYYGYFEEFSYILTSLFFTAIGTLLTFGVASFAFMGVIRHFNYESVDYNKVIGYLGISILPLIAFELAFILIFDIPTIVYWIAIAGTFGLTAYGLLIGEEVEIQHGIVAGVAGLIAIFALSYIRTLFMF